MSKESIEFEGRPIKRLYSKGYFKIYSIEVDKDKYPLVKRNNYGNVSILGELPDLQDSVTYKITATEESSKYGYSYRVVNLFRDIPLTKEDTIAFLQEAVTERQAKELYKNYPDIIERVRNNNLDDIDLSKLYGIGEKTFSIIVSKIKGVLHLAEYIKEFKDVFTLAEVKKLYSSFESLDVLKEKLKKEPYTTLTTVSGIGFKKADSIVMRLQESGAIEYGYDVKRSVDRCIACIMYLLEQNEKDGNTKMNIVELRKQCYDMVPACSDKFTEAIRSEYIYYNKDRLEVSLYKTYMMERSIAQKIVEGVNIKSDIWDYDVSKYRNTGEFDLSDEQVNIAEVLCKNQVCILNGSAGSGKSASTRAIINMLDDNNKSYTLLAPTGKSAKVLADFTKRRAATIHRELFRMERDEHESGIELFFVADVIIVDEFSMVDVSLLYRLLKHIDLNATKILMIGDSAQLPSVGSGNILHDFIASKIIPTVTLNKIFRYKDGGLMKVATDTRLSRTYLNSSMSNGTTMFGDNKDYVFIDSVGESIVSKAILLYKKLLDKGCNVNDIQVLCCKNVGDYGTLKMNEYIQQIANPNYNKENGMKVGDIVYYEGDLVIECVNNYDAESAINSDERHFIANGESGIIKEVSDKYAIIDFDGILVRYDNESMDKIKLGYAITVHKSQGSSIENVILLTSKSDAFVLNSNLIYVGLTRTKKRCYHIGTLNTINKAIKKKADMKRSTFMKQLLLEFNNEAIDNNNQMC